MNGDEEINIFDLITAKQAILGRTELDDAARKAADYNDDGIINIIDLLAIKLAILS